MSMTEKELFKEIGMIKDEYVAEAEDYKRSIIHNPIFKRTLATAACLVLCVGIYWSVRSISSSDSTANVDFMGLKADKTTSEQAVQKQHENLDIADMSTNAVEADNTNKTDGVEESFPKEPASGQNQHEITENMQMPENEAQRESASIAEDSAIVGAQPAPTDGINDAEQKLQEAKTYSILHGVVESGQEHWDEFLQNVNSATTATINIVQYTIEGDPIITSLHFDGQMFQVVYDNTQDAFAGNGAGISESSYKYLNILQNDTQTEVILSQEANLTTEELHSGEHEAYSLFQYNIK